MNLSITQPQTNNAQDQPYELLINKFVVDVGGTKSGLIPDDLPPTTTILTPDLLHTSAATVLSGITNDSESGIKDVRIVLRDRSLNKFYNFANSSFAGAIGNGNHPASLTNAGGTSSNWSYTVQLPDGQYTLGVRSIDNAGNFSNWEFRRFTVDSNDNPTASITNPAADDTALPAGPFTLSGNATDPDGTGFKFVRIAIRK